MYTAGVHSMTWCGGMVGFNGITNPAHEVDVPNSIKVGRCYSRFLGVFIAPNAATGYCTEIARVYWTCVNWQWEGHACFTATSCYYDSGAKLTFFYQAAYNQTNSCIICTQGWTGHMDIWAGTPVQISGECYYTPIYFKGKNYRRWTLRADVENLNLRTTHSHGTNNGIYFPAFSCTAIADFGSCCHWQTMNPLRIKGTGTTFACHCYQAKIQGTGCQSAINFSHTANGGAIGFGCFTGAPDTNTFFVSNGYGCPQCGLVMTNSGKVGIGTLSPCTALHVNGSITYPEDSYIYFEGDNDDALNRIGRNSGENALLITSRFNAGILIDSNNDDTTSAFTIGHNGTTLGSAGTLMRVQSDGNVGIGTASPCSRLNVGLPHTMTSPSEGTRYLNFQNYEIGPYHPNTCNDGIENAIMVGTAGGANYTAKPSEAGLILHSESNTVDSLSPAIMFGSKSSSGSYSQATALIAAQRHGTIGDANWHCGSLHFYTATDHTHGTTDRGLHDDPAMSIASSGNVGIGCTSPAEMLDVNGNVKASIICSTNYFKSKQYGTAYRSGYDAGWMRMGATASWAAGTIGFNFASADTNSNSACIPNTHSGSAGYAGILFSGYSHGIVFLTCHGNTTAGTAIAGPGSTSANVRMKITGAGNVGINTTTPVAKFQVFPGVSGNAGGCYRSVLIDKWTTGWNGGTSEAVWGMEFRHSDTGRRAYLAYDHNSSEEFIMQSNYGDIVFNAQQHGNLNINAACERMRIGATSGELTVPCGGFFGDIDVGAVGNVTIKTCTASSLHLQDGHNHHVITNSSGSTGWLISCNGTCTPIVCATSYVRVEASTPYILVKGTDTYSQAKIEVYGVNQADACIYIGQEHLHGGMFKYCASPDTINFLRRANGTDVVTADYVYNCSKWRFCDSIQTGGTLCYHAGCRIGSTTSVLTGSVTDALWDANEYGLNDEQRRAVWNSSCVTNRDESEGYGQTLSIAGGLNVGGHYGSMPPIAIHEDDCFMMTARMRTASGTSKGYMGSIDYNCTGSQLGGNPGSWGYWTMSNHTYNTTWCRFNGFIGGFGNSTGQFKTGTKFWTPQALFNYQCSCTTYLQEWKVYKVNRKAPLEIQQPTGQMFANLGCPARHVLRMFTFNDGAMTIQNKCGSANNGIALNVGSGTPWLDFSGSQFSFRKVAYSNEGIWGSGTNVGGICCTGVIYATNCFTAPYFSGHLCGNVCYGNVKLGTYVGSVEWPHCPAESGSRTFAWASNQGLWGNLRLAMSDTNDGVADQIMMDIRDGKVTVCKTLIGTSTSCFTANESLGVKGIRGCFTNEYLHLYNKVGIGHPSGWGQGEGNTPDKGLSVYGPSCIGYGCAATITSCFAHNLNVQGAITAPTLCSTNILKVGTWQLSCISGTSYVSMNSWINVGNIGLYSGTNSAHIMPNSTTDYGAWRITGARNGWNGMNMCDLTIMANGSGGGLFNDTDNDWVLYYAKNDYTYLYYNGAVKIATTNTGMHVTGAITATGDITAYSSDRRLKCNILTITCATDRIKALRGVEFEWDRKYICNNNLNFTPSEKEKTVGFIAQELENTLPTAVREAPLEGGLCREVSWAEKYKTIKAEKIIPLLVEATKEQQCTIEKQQRQINTLTCQVEMLLKRCA